MSHSKERAEKNCLNCGAHVAGRYCQLCGQENTEPKESVWGLVSHFANDITHFDGKFFSTVKYLLIKPGFLSQEYIKGRRASYLHPIRMYVFTSAFFFIIFFSIFNPETIFNIKKDKDEQLKELTAAQTNLRQNLQIARDTINKTATSRALNNISLTIDHLKEEIDAKKIKDSVKLIQARKNMDSLTNAIPVLKGVSKEIADGMKRDSAEKKTSVDMGKGTKLTFKELPYNSLAAYDSVQKELPEDRRDSWFERGITRKTISISSKANNDKNAAMTLFAEKFMHTLPQVLFVSLPLFALLLLMLYARRKYYYTEHAIFTIHLYCATFIFLLVYFGIDKIKTATGWNNVLSIPEVLLVIGIFFYMYKAMRKFYKQRRFKTIVKYVLINFLASIVLLALTVVFFLISMLQ